MLSGVVAQSRLDPAWCKIATSLRDVILVSGAERIVLRFRHWIPKIFRVFRHSSL
jgi:hypothetical protein